MINLLIAIVIFILLYLIGLKIGVELEVLEQERQRRWKR